MRCYLVPIWLSCIKASNMVCFWKTRETSWSKALLMLLSLRRDLGMLACWLCKSMLHHLAKTSSLMEHLSLHSSLSFLIHALCRRSHASWSKYCKRLLHLIHLPPNHIFRRWEQTKDWHSLKLWYMRWQKKVWDMYWHIQSSQSVMIWLTKPYCPESSKLSD